MFVFLLLLQYRGLQVIRLCVRSCWFTLMYSFNITHSPFWLFLSLLPPASKVWGKVIFSEACVKNSVHRGGVCCWGDAWSMGYATRGVPGPAGVPGHGGAWFRGECLVRGGWSGGGGMCGDPPVTATAAGDTHPTGIHSCS